MDTPTEPMAVLIGLASFAGGFKPVRGFVRRDDKNVVSRHRYAIGGHHAAHQVLDLLVADLPHFCRDLLTDHADI